MCIIPGRVLRFGWRISESFDRDEQFVIAKANSNPYAAGRRREEPVGTDFPNYLQAAEHPSNEESEEKIDDEVAAAGVVVTVDSKDPSFSFGTFQSLIG